MSKLINEQIKKMILKIFQRVLFYGIPLALIFYLGSPMIESTNIQYKCDNDRMKMESLKHALISFKSDMGYLPFAGKDARDSDAYFTSKDAGLGFENDTNCLRTDKHDFFQRMGLSEEKYVKLWKGPYLQDSVDVSFLDNYGNPIIYLCWNNAVYLWSAGDDEKFDFSIDFATNTGKRYGTIPEGQADDIVVKVCKLKSMKPSRLVLRDRVLTLLASFTKKLHHESIE